MKGVVIAEFVHFAEARYGLPLPAVAYNAVESYGYADLTRLVEAAAARAGRERTGSPHGEVQKLSPS